LNAFEQALRKFATDYNEINHQNLNDSHFSQCFINGNYTRTVFHNQQQFDLDGILGFLNSTSYAPLPDTEEYQIITQIITEAFDKYSENGYIIMNYETELFWGTLK